MKRWTGPILVSTHLLCDARADAGPGDLKVGDGVNCERAMGAHVRFGGHFVQARLHAAIPLGTIDCIPRHTSTALRRSWTAPQMVIRFA
jgi:riboflavin synthase alpha subunit